MDAVLYDKVRAVAWRDGVVRLLDQRVLPATLRYEECATAAEVAAAITAMVVRGAPAIGVTAAYGAVLAVSEAYRRAPTDWRAAARVDLAALRESRPTAVNLGWALDVMERVMETIGAGSPVAAVLAAARRLHDEDIAANRRMGALGAALLPPQARVLTHCNTGALATGGYGTALGVVRAAAATGGIRMVYADETRPWLQGARLTAWELVEEGLPVTVLADGAAAARLRAGDIAAVLVGADRIAANGDTANKIGTYGLAISARHHGVPFYVVAPVSTIDVATPDGHGIPIEERAEGEVLGCQGLTHSPAGARAWNPVFDVTPAALITALITERGVLPSPDAEGMARLLAQPTPV
ncbi:S-methyl-5-thioribose-1-phosphate isomerase [Acidiferrobacter thiooxydans]|uniref:S-methyl-5-thioribose-1-phosphate isomerase n=1 Tax=Acidiferrobacter thiooxydans TaxID=163359 RepID=UPI001B873C36|nr:S-methyl-5-thioribose-1-phosphate isomerase [Acidiferrobacter thiooxydans]UEN99093.1 S-methyl-5-thioribose-1-phosphate isomerase [Acidiferrobacter thiooxydans]